MLEQLSAQPGRSIPIQGAKESITLHDLIEATSTSETLTPGSRRVIASRLRTFARVAGVPAHAIPADVAAIRDTIAKAQPGASGISTTYWGAIRSAVWAALSRAGVATLCRVGRDMPPEWRRLIDPIPAKPHALTLAPLVRAAVVLEIMPQDLDQEASVRIRDHIRATYSKAWRKPYRRAVQMLQRCQREYPDLWPRRNVKVVLDNNRYTLPWLDFPKLEKQVDMMIAEVTQPASRRSELQIRLRASTAAHRKYAALRVASAAVLRLGVSAETITALRQIVDPAWVENFVDFILERGGAEDSGNISQVCRHVNAVARHHVRVEDNQLKELINIKRSVERKFGPAEKNRKLLLMFRDPRLRVAFVKMPARVIARLMRRSVMTDADRSLGKRAFAAAFLLRVPLRISELMNLHFGTHVYDNRNRNNGRIVIAIPAEDTKNRVARNLALCGELTRLFDVYMNLFRDTRGVSCSALFPGKSGEQGCAKHMSQMLAKLTTSEIGIRMTVHQWRVVVGYIYLKRNPGAYEVVRRFLGHASIETTCAYYAFMLEDDAHDELDAVMTDMSLDEVENKEW